jgi:hypothetical protein
MCGAVVYIVLFLLFFLILTTFKGESRNKENFRDPIYLNPRKLIDDYYPKSNWTIYGPQSHILSGFPFYPKAY